MKLKMSGKLTQAIGVTTLALSGFGMPPAAQAVTVAISDTFTLNGTERMVGNELRGTVTEIGNRTWGVAGSQAVSPIFAAGGMVVGTTATSACTAFVPLSGLSSTYMSLQVDLNASGSPWAAVAFNGSATSMWSDNLLLTVNNSGGYVLYDNGLTYVTSGTAAIFTPDAFNQVRLDYDATANAVSAWINGVEIITNVSLGAYTPALNYAGFDFYAGAGAGKAVDNFQVAIIPEPVIGGLLLFGLGGFLTRRGVKVPDEVAVIGYDDEPLCLVVDNFLGRDGGSGGADRVIRRMVR